MCFPVWRKNKNIRLRWFLFVLFLFGCLVWLVFLFCLFVGGVGVLVFGVFFSILLSDNCNVFAVAVPFKKNHRDVLHSWFQGRLPDLRN